MDAKRSRQLGDIVTSSEEMLALAHNRKWQEVALLEQQRRQRVMDFFQRPIHASEAAEVERAIRLILSLNQEVTQLGKQCQARVSGEIHTQSVARVAQAAYLECAG